MLMDILIFKTNTAGKKQKKKLFPLLRKIEGIIRWNIDLEDSDRVLRVVAFHVSPQTVENTLTQAGYYCKEME